MNKDIAKLRADVERLSRKALLSKHHQRLYRAARRLLKEGESAAKAEGRS
jgi:replicative DNA helicase